MSHQEGVVTPGMELRFVFGLVFLSDYTSVKYIYLLLQVFPHSFNNSGTWETMVVKSLVSDSL